MLVLCRSVVLRDGDAPAGIGKLGHPLRPAHALHVARDQLGLRPAPDASPRDDVEEHGASASADLRAAVHGTPDPSHLKRKFITWRSSCWACFSIHGRTSPSTLPFIQGRAMDPETSSRSEEHTSELQSLMRISYAVFCLKKKTK